MAGLEIFRGCTHQELRRLMPLMTRLHVEAGRVLTQTDDAGHEFFILANGTAHVVRHRELVAVLGAGDFFGEMALLDGGRRSATVVAHTPIDVYVLNEREFRELIAGSAVVAGNMLRALNHRLRLDAESRDRSPVAAR